MILWIMFYKTCLKTNYIQIKTYITHKKMSNYILDISIFWDSMMLSNLDSNYESPNFYNNNTSRLKIKINK